MILIGSRALKLRLGSTFTRKPVDFDYVCTQPEYEDWMQTTSAKVNPTKVYPLPEFHKMIVEGTPPCEFEIIQPGSSNEMLAQLVGSDPETDETPFGLCPSLDVLFTIKDSHRFRKFETPAGCASFYKHAYDWHVLREDGAQVPEKYRAFHKLREEETYTHKLPKLNVSKMDFFDADQNGVVQTYVHDDIHRAVAMGETPAYELYLKDGSEVLTSKDKFFQVSEQVRLHGVCEEAMTLAIERSLVPHPGVWTPDFAFRFALAKVCTTITGGYFREYAFTHMWEAIRQYPRDYWDTFQRKVSEGSVRRIEVK